MSFDSRQVYISRPSGARGFHLLSRWAGSLIGTQRGDLSFVQKPRKPAMPLDKPAVRLRPLSSDVLYMTPAGSG